MLKIRKIRSNLILSIFYILVPVMAIAQKGEITGIIVDFNVKETLVGANVIIQGTTVGVSTDLDGRFKLQADPGKFNLEISYISYKSKLIEGIKVESNKTSDLGIIYLEEDSKMLSGVTVSERKKTDTEVSMISSIQTSKMVVSGITKEQISRSLDKDAAEVIRRVPGITIIGGKYVIVRGLKERYNSVWLNQAPTPSYESDSKAFSFDVIPSSALDRLMIYKTPAPELPADFAGASIQIFTKNVPEKNSISIGYKAGFRQGTTFGDFDTYEGGKTDWLGFDDGSRTLPVSFPSTEEIYQLRNKDDIGLPADQTYALFAARDAKLIAVGQSLNKIWSPQKKTAPIDHSFDIEFNRKFVKGKITAGNITALTYRNENLYSEVRKIQYQNNFGDTNYRYRDDISTNNITIGLLHNWSFMLKNGTVIELRNFVNQIGTKKTTQRNGFDFYRESQVQSHEMYFMSRTTYSGQISAKHNLSESSSFDWIVGYSYANRNDPDIRRVYSLQTKDSTSQYFQLYSVAFVKGATPELNGRLFLKLTDHNWNVGLNYTYKFNFNGYQPEIKAGFYYEGKNREFTSRNIGFTQSYGTYDQSIGYIRPYDLIFADSNIRVPDGIIINEATFPDDSYKGLNRLIAGYVGLNFPIGPRLNIYTGVRAERNKQQLYDFYDDLPEIDSLDVIIDTLNFFPSANISFDLTEKSKFRLAYGMTVNRPEFREIAPYSFYDFVLAAQMYGNDSLKNAYIHNFDFRYELYPNIGEIITIGAFYKNFINPIENTLIPASTDKWTFQPANAKNAKSIGAEVDVKKTFKFLENYGGFLKSFKDFFIVFNAAYIISEVKEGKVYKRDEKRPMQGQSPFIINAGLYYDNNALGLMVSLAYNIIGPRIIFVGDPNTPHTIEQPRNDLELAFTKQIGKYVKIKGGFENILDDPYRMTQTFEFPVDPTNIENTTDTYELEQLYREFYAGRKFSLGVVVTF
ncbi:MAG: TonB-dependent receptor [Bacteroidales bacterium]|nr:TonB-dependent receptor [Bacteroidales bacterium]